MRHTDERAGALEQLAFGAKTAVGAVEDRERAQITVPVSIEKCRSMAIEFCRSTWESNQGLIRG